MKIYACILLLTASYLMACEDVIPYPKSSEFGSLPMICMGYSKMVELRKDGANFTLRWFSAEEPGQKFDSDFRPFSIFDRLENSLLFMAKKRRLVGITVKNLACGKRLKNNKFYNICKREFNNDQTVELTFLVLKEEEGVSHGVLETEKVEAGVLFSSSLVKKTKINADQEIVIKEHENQLLVNLTLSFSDRRTPLITPFQFEIRDLMKISGSPCYAN